ncbi:Mss4-like protein [Mycena galopus ATCC 62051]|nr:Mss4-like protein [Mycena galopus ATCC 62051]KAF8194741.1 Mss4-like protein [Mycena galopus ATCC 62051]
MPHRGECLCGQTTIEINSFHTEQTICHCLDCKQTSGSAFSTNVMVAKTDVVISGPTKEFTIKGASGNPVTRVFCSHCGSAISHLSPAFGENQAIQTGNFWDFEQIPITTEIFVKDRWSNLDPIRGAAQVQGMPGVEHDHRYLH